MRILLVEDNPGDARLIEVLLADSGSTGLELVHAAALGEGIERLSAGSFEVILLDLSLPDAHGLDTVRRMREAATGRPIVVLTGLNDESVAVEAVRAGAQDYLVKGQFESGVLMRAIRYAVERQRMQNEIARMVSELRQANETLAVQNKQLAEASEMKSNFVDMAIHDFGTPMTTIRNYLEMLRDGLLGALTDKQDNAVEKMLRSQDVVEGLRADMLEVSRFEHGRMELEKEGVNLRAVVESCVGEIEQLAASKGQVVSTEVPDLEANCDPRRIRQVVANYLSNAVRYTGEGGSIAVRAARDDGFVRVSVEDSGRGVAAVDLEKIFGGFYRSGARVPGSTGLGLAVVRKIVEAHGGRAWCESELGRGSTFHFAIPAEG